MTAAGRAALDHLVTQQGVIISYIDDYKLLLLATLAVARWSSFSQDKFCAGSHHGAGMKNGQQGIDAEDMEDT